MFAFQRYVDRDAGVFGNVMADLCAKKGANCYWIWDGTRSTATRGSSHKALYKFFMFDVSALSS